ncbi:MAG TPA: sialidase family protein, partial [Candidatus Kapabacteria bacterium]|nr:sialidase family protein [Candidatus Kapabacteria bacterium]
MRRIAIIVFLFIASNAFAQHLRIFACAIANDSGMFLGGSSNGSGLYQSDDTGKTWKHLGWDNIKCYSMDEVQSSNGRILYEATGLGVLRSTDYGEHWKQITDWRISEAMDIAVNQKTPEEIYIATAHGPWRTEDGGKSWQPLLDGLPVPYCSKVVIDSVIPDHILLATEKGSFTLTPAMSWKRVPSVQRNYHNQIEKEITAATRSIIQISKNEWRAVTAQSRQLVSVDSARSFGTSSLGLDESLYCVGEV